MTNWKICLVVCSALLWFSIFLRAQENKSQKLITLLNNGEFFNSKELHQQICDTISPEVDLYYKFRMAQFTNKIDSATIYFEKVLANYPAMFKSEVINVYAILFNMYAVNLKDYEKGKYTYERMIQHLEENPYHLDEKELALWYKGNKGRLDYLQQLRKQPIISIKRKKINSPIKIEADKRLVFSAKFNGKLRKTFFDTGCDFYYIMNRKEAEAIGIKSELSEMSNGMINKTEVLTKKVTIDSIEIGNLTLYNIPATIFEHDITAYLPDSIKNDAKKMANIDSLYSNDMCTSIGLPLMTLIGKFVIDYKNKEMTFPTTNVYLHSLKEPNLYLYNSDLYTGLELNGIHFTGTLDIGFDDYLKVDTLFFEKYQNNLRIAAAEKKESYNIAMADRIWNDLPFDIIYKPKVVFNNRRMRIPAKGAVKVCPIQSIWYGKCFDGVIGYDFFKKVGKKVLLDLDNMRLEAIK